MKNSAQTSHTSPDGPWHDGERRMHEAIGVSDKMTLFGAKFIRRFMPDQHRDFYAQLPFMVAGTIDDQDRPWATILANPPGFMTTPNRTTLQINARPAQSDPAFSGFSDGASIGLLGIELHTQRRNRANGTIAGVNDHGFTVAIEQTMGNCPKYIHNRDYQFVDATVPSGGFETSEYAASDDAYKEIIKAADTFFVATFADTPNGRMVDASHRGGKPGFVAMEADGTLIIPDFAGNRFFNTLGNILSTEKAGLVFPNFESGDLLHLTGSAEVDLDPSAVAGIAGAERSWKVKPTKIVLQHGALPLRWTFNTLSPFLRG